jgi:hypothetical protein
MNRTDTLTAAARAAAGAVADLEREAGRIDPYIPLTAWARPLGDLCSAVVMVSASLRSAAAMAADALTPDPGRPEPYAAGDARAKLAIASTHADRASDATGSAYDAVRRILRAPELADRQDPDGYGGPLGRRTAVAAQCLFGLHDALERANRATVPANAAAVAMLAQVTEQQAMAAAGMSRICAQFHYGVTEACERIPRATTRKTAATAGPLRRAARSLERAAAVTRRAHSTLAEEHARARTAAVQAGR